MLSRCPNCQAPAAAAGAEQECPGCLLRLGLGAGDVQGITGTRGLIPAEELGAIGRYQLLAVLGRGAHGVVYRAVDRALGREVALKAMPHRGSGHDLPGLRERFRREAALIARLDHPHIVPLFDHGEEEGCPWLVQKLFARGDLARQVRDPVAPRQAAAWLRDLADAVAEAHRQGILHRDIKPSNVFVDEEGRVFLGDFGIARNINDATGGITLTGQAIGSPGYMSPEQARGAGAEVGPAADIHGLGALLYHLLTGFPPYRGSTVESTLRQVIDEDPLPIRRLNPSVPSDLENVCLKCLEKDPTVRYRSAVELREDLDRFLADRPVRVRPVSGAGRFWRWCRRRPAVAGLTAALAISLVGGLAGMTTAWLRVRDAVQRQQQSRDALAFEMFDIWERQHSTRRGLDALADILRESPHHRPALRRAWNTLDQGRLPVPLFEVGVSNCLRAAFDASGARILLWTSDGRLTLVDAGSGQTLGEQADSPDDRVAALGFSPTGDHVWLLNGDQRLRAWSVPSWEPWEGPVPSEWCPRPATLPPALGVGGPGSHELSPDGRHAIVRRGERDYELLEVATGRVIRRSAGEDYLLPPFPMGGPVLFPRTPSPGQPVRFITWAVDRLGIREVETGKAVGDPVNIGRPIEFGCWHPAGHRLLVVPLGGRPILFSVPPVEPVGPARDLRMEMTGLKCSPDGRFLATESPSQGVRLFASRTLEELHAGLSGLAGSRWALWTDAGLLAVTLDGRAHRVDPGATSAPVVFQARGPLASVAVSPDRRWIATLDLQGRVELRDSRHGWERPVASKDGPAMDISDAFSRSNGVTHLGFHRAGSRLVMTLNGGDTRTWTVPRLDPTPLAGPGPFTYGATFHPAEESLVVADLSGRILAWDLRSGPAPSATALDPLPFVGRALFDDAGRHLLLVAMGGLAQIRSWPPQRGEQPRIAVAGGAWQIAAVPGEPSCVVARQDGIVELLSLPGALVQARWKLRHQGWPNWLVVSPDATRIILGTTSGQIFELPLPPASQPVPDWFFEWVDAMGEGATTGNADGSRSAGRRIPELRQRLAALAGDGYWDVWGRSLAHP